MTSFASRLASERPGQVALRDQRQQLGWGDLDGLLNRVANALLACDLGEARRVAVFAENSCETVVAHLGGILGSTSVVPIGFHHTVDELAYLLGASDVRLVFVGPETAERALACAGPELRVVGWRCADHASLEPWDRWLATADPSDPPVDVVPRPNLLFTSGTTGRPKATELPPAMSVGGATMAEHVERLRQHKFAPFGSHLVVGPLHHTGPLQAVRLPAAGVPVVVQGRFDPQLTLDNIERFEIATSVMVPTHFTRLLNLSAAARDAVDVSSLRHVVHTGAPCPEQVKRRMIDWWGPVLFESYGGTEVGTVTSISSAEWLERPGSVGRCVAQFEALVLDDGDQAVPAGVEGRLFFRDATGRGISYASVSDSEPTAQPVEPGLFTLGEVGFVDPGGYVFVTDRSSDLVLSGGVNVYPAEAERVLALHPAVADVACVGVPDDDLGERLAALVALDRATAAPTGDELLSWCRRELGGPKSPREIHFVESIPRTPMGKLDRRKLKAAVPSPDAG